MLVNTINFRRRSFAWIAVISIACILINVHDLMFLNYIMEWMNHNFAQFCFFRLGIIFCFILFWSFLVKKIGKSCGATPEQIVQWKNERWRIGAWLLLFELCICENLITKIIHFLG